MESAFQSDTEERVKRQSVPYIKCGRSAVLCFAFVFFLSSRGRKKPASDDDPDGPHIGFLLYARQSFSFTLPLKSNYCYPHFTDEETGCLRGYREARKLAQSPIHKKGSQDLNLGASSQIIPIREKSRKSLQSFV